MTHASLLHSIWGLQGLGTLCSHMQGVKNITLQVLNSDPATLGKKDLGRKEISMKRGNPWNHRMSELTLEII